MTDDDDDPFSLTVADFKVLEGHIRAGVADEHLSVEGEHDVHLSQVDHTSHHVP